MSNEEYEDISNDDTLVDFNPGYSDGTWEQVGPSSAVMRVKIDDKNTVVAFVRSSKRVRIAEVYLNGDSQLMNHRTFKPIEELKKVVEQWIFRS